MHKETGLQINILIVDDDKAIADILKDFLSGKGRSVEVRYDGLAAIECLQAAHFDLVIVDLVMPGVGGLDVLKYAKEINPDVIVIIITGYASLETAITAVKEGAYDYIRKPCKLEEIKIVVENAIDKIQLNRENGELLQKLQDAYHELMTLKKERHEDEKITSVNFFPSSMPSPHYFYHTGSPPSNHIDKLQALSSLKENGLVTESEFKTLKRHLLETVNMKE
jgi:DNA-binding response OmpR family regulator